jgi:hypothetical protein
VQGKKDFNQKNSNRETEVPFRCLEEPGQAAEISYDAGADLVVRTFSAFSPDLGEFAAMTLQNRWIEAEDRSGKRTLRSQETAASQG